MVIFFAGDTDGLKQQFPHLRCEEYDSKTHAFVVPGILNYTCQAACDLLSEVAARAINLGLKVDVWTDRRDGEALMQRLEGRA